MQPEGWHRIPKDDAWRQVHLMHFREFRVRLWIRCNACGHSITPDPEAFADAHRLEMMTPLLAIAARLKCSRCGARKAHCWPEPYRCPISANERL